MAGVFACPECGQELEIEGLSPGREVQCDECSTWVEVPYFPRAAGWKRERRPRKRSPWESKALRAAGVCLGIALLGLFLSRMIGGRVRSENERVMAELVASADQAEGSRRYDVALREIEGALAHARTFVSDRSERLAELRERRDRVSLLEAQGRLDSIDKLAPDRAVGEALTLVSRAKKDPALASLADSIEAKLDESRHRQAEADLVLARQHLEAGKDPDAFDVAERLYDRAGSLSAPEAKRFEKEARAVLEAAVGRSGVGVPAVAGKFVAGSFETYTAKLEKNRVTALRKAGYLPRPRKTTWAMLWDEKAPFLAPVEVTETQQELYLQSKNRTTQIDGTFELLHKGRSVWNGRIVARTRAPLPDLPAYLAGHLAVADRRDPDTERRLHEDALIQFVEQSARTLRGLPGREVAALKP